MDPLEAVIIIPAYKPEKKMLHLIQELQETGFGHVVVVDDGGGSEYWDIFQQAEALGCMVERHEQNQGKGTAIKTALKAASIKWNTAEGYITADADGQHLPKDILRVAQALAQNPDALILGVRDFGGENVPPRSKFGNRVTSVFFRLISGVACPDTQTGLRGIPVGLMDLALAEEGERYEYEMNFLMDAARKAPMKFVDIETVYEDKNRTSHFRPIADSLRVYGRFVRFVLASLAGAAVDCLLFFLIALFLAFAQTEKIFLATVLARMGSGTVNFLLNRHYSFRSRMPVGREIVRYMILFLGQMMASAVLVSLLAYILPMLLSKVIVDTVLFFLSFRIQKNWVFAEDK
ncbi:MAG: glycosyltransferase [Lachnospiraceae bacterium]|nr:glycosyltransferase [Lachnospiraceae bacterium]